MKKILLPCLLTILAASAAPARGEGEAAAASDGSAPLVGFEIRVGGIFYDADDWDDDAGAFGDLGVTLWEPNEVLGLWAGFGVQGAELVWNDPWGEVGSDVSAVPVGASLLLRCELSDLIALRGEAGIRYVAMDVEDWDDDYDRRRRRWGDRRDLYWNPDRYLDVDDTSMAIASLQLEFALGRARLFFGGGYQFDLEKPDVTYCDRRIGSVDLSGAFFHLGGGFVF